MSKKQFRQPGMRRWGEQPGQRGGDRWDANLVKLSAPPKNQPVLVRPVAGIITIGIHWISFKKQDGTDSAFPTLCPNWNIATQSDEPNGCPVCQDFHRNLRVSKEDEYLKMQQKYRYLFHAFHVSNIKDGVKDKEKLFGLIETHGLGMEQIENAVMMKGHQPPDDPVKGYCLNWAIRDSKKGSKYGKTEVVFAGADSLRVKEKKNKDGEGIGEWLIKVGKRTVKGIEQSVADAVPAPPTPEELRQKLASLGLYTALERATGASVRGGSAAPSDDFEEEAPPPAGGDEDDWDEAEDGGSDDAGDDWDEGEDATDDFGDDDESAGPSDADDFEEEAEGEESDDAGDEWDEGDDATEAEAEEEEATDPDEDDWDEGEDAEPEPEPEPPKKKKAKKKAAPKKKKAPAKKKKAAEEAPADDDDGNWDDWDE